MDFIEIIKLFDGNDFYYRTKRPESVNETIIKELVYNKDAKTWIIKRGAGTIGIMSITTKRDSLLEHQLHYRIKSNENNYEVFQWTLRYLKDELNELDAVAMEVYSFDIQYLELLKKFNFQLVSTYREHVYKHGKYHDIFEYKVSLIEGVLI